MFVERVNAPIKQQVLDSIRAEIFRGEFKPGLRLIEKHLCKISGASRTCVREALRHLEAEGLVQMVPQKGPIVAVLTTKDAREIYEMRKVLESLACQLFAERASQSEINALLDSVKRMEVICQSGNVGNIIDEKNVFYEIILKGCGNKLLYNTTRTLHARVVLLRSTSLSKPTRLPNAISEIKRITEAIEARDPDLAWRTCMDHVELAQAVALEVINNKEVSGLNSDLSNTNIAKESVK
jgi:GntR family transcriptional regulator, trigonelline degradation regulator